MKSEAEAAVASLSDSVEESVVYHCSPFQGLTELTPRVSSHGHAWVYATDDVVVASVFLGRLGGDLTCQTGTLGGKPYLVERFAGGFERRYGGISGSIYVLPAAPFQARRTSWKKDLVSEESVKPLREISVPDAATHLRNLALEERLILKYFPERFCIPDDDEDLVLKAVQRYRAVGPNGLHGIETFHPNLMERVRRAIAKDAGP